MKKICKHHGELKPEQIATWGNRSRCKLCDSLQRKSMYKRDIEKFKIRSKENYLKHKEARAAYSRQYYQEHKEKILTRQREKKMNIVRLTEDEIEVIKMGLFSLWTEVTKAHANDKEFVLGKLKRFTEISEKLTRDGGFDA